MITPPPRSSMPGSTARTQDEGGDNIGIELGVHLLVGELEDGHHAPGPVSTALFTRRSIPPQCSITCSTALRSAARS